jgi:spore maturation protein CgeB
VLPVTHTADVISYLKMPDERRRQIGENARRRTLRCHSAAVRAQQFEDYIEATLDRMTCSKKDRIAVQVAPTMALI